MTTAANAADERHVCGLCYECMDQPVRCSCPCRTMACRVCYLHALGTCQNRCPWTRNAVDWTSIAVDAALEEEIARSASCCSYPECDFSGTVAECIRHERTCVKKVCVRPGYYHLHHCSDHDFNNFETRFVANDMFFEYRAAEEEQPLAADGGHGVSATSTDVSAEPRGAGGTPVAAATSTRFTVRSILGLPWRGEGCLRRNGSCGFYIWSEPDGSSVSYTTIIVLPSGDIIGRVRGDPSKGAHWTYRSVYVSPQPPEVASGEEGEEDEEGEEEGEDGSDMSGGNDSTAHEHDETTRAPSALR